jgi:type I restriction enzyme R subunit
MFSKEDVQGALANLKNEIPILKNAHTRVMRHFEGLDLNDLDECILSLKDDVKRQSFQTDFAVFSKQMDIILPDSSATPFLYDLKRLGKIAIGARNLYRDEQLDISGAGEKVRELIEEHIYSTGIDPKIPPVDLLAANYEEALNQHKTPRAKASEIENAIKAHIKINIEEDPEYYKKLSERLEDIIDAYEEKWDELVQLLLNFKADIVNGIDDPIPGLTRTEIAFYNILIAELDKGQSIDSVTTEKAKSVVQSLVAMLDDATKIVGFFQKWDEQKRVKRDIKRVIIQSFNEELVKPVTERFMELAEVKFK